MNSTLLRGLAAVALAGVLLTGPPPPSAHAAGAATKRLCSVAPCGVTVPTAMGRDGADVGFRVTGAAGQTLELRAWLVRWNPDGSYAGLDPYSLAVSVRLDERGLAEGSVRLAHNGGRKQLSPWVLIAPLDVDPEHPERSVGAFIPLASTTPELLGDGYGLRKPRGVPLTLSFYGADPAMSVTVQYLADDGSWRETLADRKAQDPYPRVAADPRQSTQVSYLVPDGLGETPRPFRLVDVASGRAALIWELVPSATGDSSPVKAVWVPPQTVSRAAPDAPQSTNPGTGGRVPWPWVLGGTAALCLTILTTAVLISRRPRPGPARAVAPDIHDLPPTRRPVSARALARRRALDIHPSPWLGERP